MTGGEKRNRLIFFVPFLLALLLRTSACASPFSDIPSDHWAKQPAESLAAKGFVTGFSPDVFGGSRPATRYETAVILTRMIVYLEKKRSSVPLSELEALKEKLADYRDEIDRLGLDVQNLENAVADLESRVTRLERIHTSGEFHNRTLATQIKGILGTGIGQDTEFALSNPTRQYTLFPVQAGENSTSLGYLDVSANLNDSWEGGGRIAAYDNVGHQLNGLVWGGAAPFLSNPFLGYPANNLRVTLDRFYAKTESGTLAAELGSFYPAHSPSYFYSGVPNLAEEGPDFLPNFGGRLEADMKPYLVISKAYSEIYAGKLAQASAWQTEIYGANAGIEALGVSLNAHWMAAQNDPANMAAGASGLITVPINGGGGWLDPLLLTPLAVGPQKEKALGIDLSVTRTYAERPFTFRLEYSHSDYKPNTNSSNNAGAELYDLRLETGAFKNLSVGAEYMNVDPKYSPFILPFALPSTLTTSTFPWGQWPFAVDFQGYYTLQNSREYPQNRQGAKVFFTWTAAHEKITGNYRWLSQKIATQLSSFNNDTDIQSIGFYEPLFTAAGTRPLALPTGITRDWNLTFHHDLTDSLAFEALGSGVTAKRFTGDANNIDFSGWLGQAGFVYSFWQKWKFNLAYDVAHIHGRLLAAPSSPPNDQLRNTGEVVRLDYSVGPKTNAFFWFRTLDHTQVPGSSNFHMLQFLTGLDEAF